MQKQLQSQKGMQLHTENWISVSAYGKVIVILTGKVLSVGEIHNCCFDMYPWKGNLCRNAGGILCVQ